MPAPQIDDKQALRRLLLERFPVFAELPAARLAQLLAEAQLVRVPAGSLLFDARQPCRGFPLVLEGSVRVAKATPSGREIVCTALALIEAHNAARVPADRPFHALSPLGWPPRCACAKLREEAPMEQITAEMKVADVIRRCPATVDVFLARGCPDMRRGFFNLMAQLMSVRNAARVHRLELAPLLEDLNKVAQGLTGVEQNR